MPFSISGLRRWFAAATIGLVLLVAAVYFYARHKVQNALKEVPARIGLEVQQSAQGFTISRSAQGHTLFKVQASKAVQFKQGGRAELHDVTITLYGSDSSRFDQIYGTDFEYDPQSGDVIGKGQVQMDLEANPEGLMHPDQAAPKELKNPIHITTTNLLFNQKTGNASTQEKVEFSFPEANGSAVGLDYIADTAVLTLLTQVEVDYQGSTPARLTAVRGTISKNPRVVSLDLPQLQSASRHASADKGTLYLRPDNSLERILAVGNVHLDSQDVNSAKVESNQMELLMAERQNTLRTAIFTGDVRVVDSGKQPMQGSAGRAVLNFVGNNVLTTVHTQDNVRLTQHQQPAKPSESAQDVEINASVIDFVLADGRRLKRADTSGAAQVAIRPSAPATGQTLVTAGKFQARFDDLGQLASVHGAPDARIVSQTPGQPDRVSTSATLDASFHPGSGIDSLVQQGSVAYYDGERKAWGERASYTPADQILVLTGSPRIVDGGMTTTARIMRMNRATGDASAEDDVKSTYSDLKAQPNGALLASSDPIHVSAHAMTAHSTPAIALYTGDARLWQNANVIEAPAIEFDRNRRSVVARGSPTQSVSTVLVQTEKSGKVTPIKITSARLSYADSQRKAHFEDGVQAKAADLTITAREMDVFLQPRDQPAPNQAFAGTGKIDHIVAREQVVITQPSRKATGDELVYTSSDDKFVLSGGPPSIFDAEHGKITGVSLTLFRHDDRVLVEGDKTSPTVTQTRVAR
ncbi:MAG TPA: LPS export ABC transporter periplasmic protein LptC [Terriglobales bacterium]|jgi:lipopolysaccharide export system protein LptA|nr:LPS export ABC transporter periplasmic protein LptC [Terriglobales bacterium]